MSYMKDSTGRRLDDFVVVDAASPAFRTSQPAPRQPIAPSVVPAVVTYGSNGTTTLAGSVLTDYTNPAFRFMGADMIPDSNPWYVRAKPIGNSQTVGGASVSFGFFGRVFEWRTARTAGMYRIWVNGQPLTPDFQSQPGTLNADYLVKVDLGSVDTWEIRIDLDRCLFGGVRLLPTDLIFPPLAPRGPRMLILGDSFGNGQSNDGVAPTYTPGYYYWLSEMIRIDDVWPRAIGGTGYLNTNNGTQPTYRGRLAVDVIPYHPDILLFQGTINDEANVPLVTAEINALYAAVRAALPDAFLIATSPLVATAPGANRVTLAATEKAAWEALGVPYIDLMNMNTGNGNAGQTTYTDGVTTSGSTTFTSATANFAIGAVGTTITGAGIPAGTQIQAFVNSTTVTLSQAATATATGVTFVKTGQRRNGSADYNNSADSTHATYPRGYRHIAQRLASGLAPILRASV